MRFSEIQQGTRARCPAELPLAGARLDPATGKWEGPTVRVELVPLLGDDIARIQAAATAYAKAKDIEPKEGEAAYDIAIAIHTVHAATRVPGSDLPFFDVPPDDLFRAEGVGLDAFVYLHERQMLWQAETSPRPGFVTPDELALQIERMGGAADEVTFFYARLQPAARLICLLTMARLLHALQTRKSGSGTASTSATASASKRPSTESTRRANKAARKRPKTRART